jgi:hypothetical protein
MLAFRMTMRCQPDAQHLEKLLFEQTKEGWPPYLSAQENH